VIAPHVKGQSNRPIVQQVLQRLVELLHRGFLKAGNTDIADLTLQHLSVGGLDLDGSAYQLIILIHASPAHCQL